jgi:hypothetical protein
MNAAAPAASRWGPLKPQTWPQDENHVPSAPGMPMPPVSVANAQRSRRESFTMSGTFNFVSGVPAGLVLPLYLATDPDGDFWADQIYMNSWVSAASSIAITPPPSIISIADARTGRALTYPSTIPTHFISTINILAADPGFDVSALPFPSGQRSTSILPQPFCFTRAGGISMVMTVLPNMPAGQTWIVDIAFGGWKEYESAST